ncbi:hypothetical protein OIU84_008657 [Salix udensis]|uniref:Uncharacterized protein n=1 Tax=Salix udensis TaxID=889485 RepID=A0AAD6JPK2_9ROSI|nr:hypothetical protein OIU84_008657 [Salix udensis]
MQHLHNSRNQPSKDSTEGIVRLPLLTEEKKGLSCLNFSLCSSFC